MSSATASDVSLIRGGPFYKVQAAVRLIAPGRWNLGRRCALAIAVGWVPLVLITLANNPHAIASLLTDYEVNARMLVAVPVLLAGQLLMDDRFRDMVLHIRDAGLLSPSAEAKFERLLGSILRLHHSTLPELVILVAAYARIAALIRLGSDQGLPLPVALDSAGPGAQLSSAGWYYLVVSQLIYQFLLGISLWTWLLVTYFLFRLSRLDLKLVPTHPDRRGGLGFLELAPIAIIPTLFAASVAIGGSWRSQILREGVKLASLKIDAAALVVLGLTIALAPLLVFVPILTRVRREGMLAYGTLGQIHSTEFHKKWILERSSQKEDFLAAPEVSTLTDLGTSYLQVENLRPMTVHRGVLLGLALAITVPLIPVVIAEIPLPTVLKSLFDALA